MAHNALLLLYFIDFQRKFRTVALMSVCRQSDSDRPGSFCLEPNGGSLGAVLLICTYPILIGKLFGAFYYLTKRSEWD